MDELAACACLHHAAGDEDGPAGKATGPETTKRYTKITRSELKKHFDNADRQERRPG
jgi:hypothetical protein